MDLALSTHAHEGWAVIDVSGELDLSNAPQLDDAVQQRMAEGDRRLAIDLSEVSFMDSSALGVLVRCLKRLNEEQGDLVLVGANGAPRRVLEITGLDRTFTIVPDLRSLPA